MHQQSTYLPGALSDSQSHARTTLEHIISLETPYIIIL